jgi:hypothetical protein
MKSSSLRKAGIENPRLYRDALIHDWELAPEFISHLNVYILRETTPEQLFFHLNYGEIIVQGKQYSVVWCSSPSEVRLAEYLLISLRYCPHLERGYALVKILKGNSQFDKLEY